MNLKELIWPVRIYWDLAQAHCDSVNCLKICEEIIETKILYLGLHDFASPLSPSCLAILDRLKDQNIAVSLTIPSSALNPSIPARLSDSKIKTLLINFSSFNELQSSMKKIGQCRNPGLHPGISFDIGKDNYRDITDVVSFCLNNGISDLVFPIQRLTAERNLFYINRKEREELALKLSRIDYSKLRVTIHDPFLWKVFYPDTDYHEGGCQAANSMLYISPEYRVYPCQAMPVELGDLHETTLGEIIMSRKKKEVRLSLLNPPEECAACDQVNKCLGGCRGRAFASTSSLSRRDPACK